MTDPSAHDGGSPHGMADGDEVVGTVMSVWSRVLNIDVTPTSDFFAVGGGSLAAAEITEALIEELGLATDAFEWLFDLVLRDTTPTETAQAIREQH